MCEQRIEALPGDSAVVLAIGGFQAAENHAPAGACG